MDDVLDEVVSSEDLHKFEKVFHEQLHQGKVTPKAQFEYAWCLVRSKYATDIKKGNARIKEYNKALHHIKKFLEIEPANQQVLALERQINKRMEKEGMVGIAMAGGAMLVMGGLVGLGIAMASRK